MNFRDYKHFNNPRGLRNNGPYSALDAARYTDPGMGWAKLAVGGSEHVDAVKRLLGHGCMPIIQIVRERMGAAPLEDAWWDITSRYIQAGALWFEFYDEPNAPHFWPAELAAPSWHDTDHCIAPVMDHWLAWAERIVTMGAYPAFPAMAETTVPEQATVSWVEACLTYLAQHQADRFGKLVASGLWCATHPYLLNHFYQEPPGGPPTADRPFYQQSRHEGGWHFEYPYDPLQQHDDPGRTPFGGTARSMFGDPNGLVCSGEIFSELLNRLFGTGPVPVVGTAGGITPIPGAHDEPIQVDTRYQGYSRDSHGEATAALFRWMAESGPPWLLGLTLSSEADYYPGGIALPAMVALVSDPPVLREPLDLEIREGRITPAVHLAAEPSPLDPLAPASPPASAPSDLPNMGLFMPEPQISTPPPEPAPAEPAPEETAPVDSRLKEVEPAETTLKPVEPVDSTLKEVEPVDSTLKPVEPQVTTLAEPSSLGDPYAVFGTGHEETSAEPPASTADQGDPYAVFGTGDIATPPAEHEEPSEEHAAPEVIPLLDHSEPPAAEAAHPGAFWVPESETGPDSEMRLTHAEDTPAQSPGEPEPASEDRLIPEDEVFPELTSAMDKVLEASDNAPEPEPEESPAPTVMWPAPEAHEEAPDDAPPVEPAAPVTVLWPAPQASEEVHTPPTAAPQPAPELSEPRSAGVPVQEEMPAPTVMWPAPEAHEEAPDQPPPVEPAAPLTVLWPAPQAGEEVHTPPPERSEPRSAELAGTPRVEKPQPAVIAAPPGHAGKLGPGPGPFGGIVSDHWLMAAPGLPTDWLLGSARRYWDAFRVPIVNDPGLIGVVPPDHSLAVTLVASKAGADAVRANLAAEWPNVRVDVVAGDSPADIQTELDRRAREMKEFG